MRILLISHTCQSITEGQPKAYALAALPDVDLRVLVPDRWRRYGQWRSAQPPTNSKFQYEIAKVRLPWLGPAQTYLHHYPSLPKILAEFRPDVIDLWEEPWSLVSAHACRLRERILPHAKIVSETEQNIDKTLPFPFELFRSYTLRRADFAVGRNTEAIKVLRNKGYRGPAEVIPNAVDAELFTPLDRAECRRSLNLSGFVVGYAGRFVEEKGLLDLIEALRQCPPDVHLLLIGNGPLKPVLDQLAKDPALAGRITLLDSKPLQELPTLMNAMDVLVLPSQTTPRWKEQFGRVLIEANACGTPVIGSDSGAIPDVISGAGLIVPERNPAALAGAIRALRDFPDHARTLGETGRRQVLENYTWKRVAERMRDIYLKILSKN
jgi:glycosyltransferase involved in cell wall biosynthesis